jgi:hypothetical protein
MSRDGETVINLSLERRKYYEGTHDKILDIVRVRVGGCYDCTGWLLEISLEL